jgi:hypothetical protein
MLPNRAPGHWVWDAGEGGYMWSILDNDYSRFVLSDPRNFTPQFTPGLVLTMPNTGRVYCLVLTNAGFSEFTYLASPESAALNPGLVLTLTLPDDLTGYQLGFIDYGAVPVTPKADRFPWLPDALPPAYNIRLWDGATERHLVPDSVFDGTGSVLIDADSIIA